MGLGFIRGFVTVDFFEGGSLAPRPNPNLEDKGLHFVWPLPFDLCGKDGTAKSFPASIVLRVIGPRKASVHNKAIVFEEVFELSHVTAILFFGSYRPDICKVKKSASG
jgi:hypothetical protein